MMQPLVDLLREGGYVMYPLLLCSIVALAIVLERALYFSRLTRRGATLLRELEAALRGSRSRAAALAVLDKYRGPLPAALHSGVEAWARGATRSQIETAMEEGAQSTFGETRRGLPVLDTVITIAPLLGLLGTITGMMGTFRAVAERMANNPNGDPSAVTGGIAEALIATAAGIAIAIVTLVFYNAFNALNDDLLSETELRCTQLLRVLDEVQSEAQSEIATRNGHPAAVESAVETAATETPVAGAAS